MACGRDTVSRGVRRLSRLLFRQGRMSRGEYIKRHVTGAHVADALESYARYTAADVTDIPPDDVANILERVADALALVRRCADTPARRAAEKSLVAVRDALKKVPKK